jgi:hypothetical protein
MSFFEPPPPPPLPPREHFQPEWIGPPENVLGVALPIRLLLARTESAAVLVQHVTVYPKGMHFELSIYRRSAPEDPTTDPWHAFHMWRHTVRGGELPPELLRFGVQLADGSKATTLGPHPYGPDRPPEHPVLLQHGGGGGGLRYDMGLWLWPLPPAGPLGFVVEWPSEGIEETRVEIDAEPIRKAAQEAETLWPLEGGESPREEFTSHFRLVADSDSENGS